MAPSNLKVKGHGEKQLLMLKIIIYNEENSIRSPASHAGFQNLPIYNFHKISIIHTSSWTWKEIHQHAPHELIDGIPQNVMTHNLRAIYTFHSSFKIEWNSIVLENV